jgi:thioredoxin 1
VKKFLFFGAEWCAPCKNLKPWVRERVPADALVEVDVDQRTDLRQQYGVASVPTIVVTDGEGLQIERMNGEALIRRNLARIVAG